MMKTVTPERLELVKAAFTDAVDAHDAARQRIIQRLDRKDPIAADMLRQLLKTHDDPQDDLFLEPIVRLDEALTEPTARAAALPNLGERYRVIRLLGCGGVGDVYLAEEAVPVSRQVAIKVFRPHRLDGIRLRRFGIEARALGTLSHPGIAQVFGAGEGTDGRPFLAMEYVPGLPIDEACIKPGLDERAILKLFIELCEAVQHAHHRGIIHRDLKPSNVLVVKTNNTLQVKIIDFGVAKLADEAGARPGSLTLHGQILGTLDYMSPEQWRGEQADTRSDVYSLAVILYRMLTRRMPFGKGAAMTSCGVPEDAQPEPMREAPNWMRRDIQTIIEKALSHDPASRFASPLHMAEDVGRLLRGEPVLARRTSLGERMIKAVRRHPRTALVGAVLLAVIFALGVNTAFERQRLAQEVHVQRAMIVGLLDEVLDRLYVLAGATDTRKAMAQSLLARTDELLGITSDDAGLLEARARLLLELGKIEFEQSYPDAGGEHLLEESVKTFGVLTQQSPHNVEHWRRYVDAMVRYSYAVRRRDYEAAVEIHDQAHAHLESLAQQYPEHLGVLDDLSWSYDRHDNFVMPRGRLDHGTYQRHQLRLDLALRLLSLDPERVLSHYNLMSAHSRLATHYYRVWDESRLWHHLNEALASGERIIALEPARRHYRHHFADLLLLNARAAMRAEDHQQAAHWFDRLDAETSALYRDDSDGVMGVRGRVTKHIEHAHASLSFADEPRVRELYLEAKELADRHPNYLDARHRRLLEELAERLRTNVDGP